MRTSDVQTFLIPQNNAKECRLSVFIANHSDEVEAAQRLRYRVFKDEIGADFPDAASSLDCDEYDPHCEHLVVRDEDSHEIVGTYRLLLPEGAQRVGHYYSETEFDLSRVLAKRYRLLELGRSCVEPQYRNGPVIIFLWAAISRFMHQQKVDALIGCCSVPTESGAETGALYARVASHLTPDALRVVPLHPVPDFDAQSTAAAAMPRLMKGYLRAGAKIGGEPAWDPQFHCSDFFIWLARNEWTPRYRQHFWK